MGGEGVTPDASEQLLRHELRIARAELARLRRRLNENGAHGKRVDRAYHDALLLAGFHIGYLPTTRAYAYETAGITNGRWENARALLRLAKVHNGRRWLMADLMAIEAALSKAKEVALDAPNAFRGRLPKHARPTEKQAGR